MEYFIKAPIKTYRKKYFVLIFVPYHKNYATTTANLIYIYAINFFPARLNLLTKTLVIAAKQIPQPAAAALNDYQ